MILLISIAGATRAQVMQMGFWFNPIDSGSVATYACEEPITDKICYVSIMLVDNNSKLKDTTYITDYHKIFHLQGEDTLHTGHINIANLFKFYQIQKMGHSIHLIGVFPSC